MINKISLLLFTLVLLTASTFAQEKKDERTIATKIADLLAQLPARDSVQLGRNMKEIADLGEDGYVTLISELKASGKGNNSLIEYAVGGFTAAASERGRESWRSMSVAAYCRALDKVTDKHNKAFIISQFDLVGNDAAVSCLESYLVDGQLADESARALVKINTPSAITALVNGLGKAQGRAKLSLVEALGHTSSPIAAEAIAALRNTDKDLTSSPIAADTIAALRNTDKDLTSSPIAADAIAAFQDTDKDLTRVRLFALANIADASSESVLIKAAEQAAFKYEPTNAVASLLLYAQKRAATDKKAGEKIGKLILKKIKPEELVNVRITALKLIYEANENQEALLNALNDKQFEYRAAAIANAAPAMNDANAEAWVKKLGKVDTQTRVLIIDMLSASGAKSTYPAFLQLFEDKDANVRAHAFAAASKLGGETAIDPLIKAMNRDASGISAISKVLLEMKGNDVPAKIAPYISGANTEVQVALINVLAARSASGQPGIISSLLTSKQPEVRKAAYASLKHIYTARHKADLFTLLDRTSDPAELADVQDALIVAFKGSSDPDSQADILLAQMDKQADDKKLLYYKVLGSIGGKKALTAVSNAFNTGNDATRAATLEALSSWADPGSSDELIKIARTTPGTKFSNLALDGFLRLARRSKLTPEQRLLMLRNAMEIARISAQKQTILKDLEQAQCYNAILFAGKYLDSTELQQAAANTVMNITMAGEYNGDLVKELLNKTIAVITGADAIYQKEGMRKYISGMKPGAGFVQIFNEKDLTNWKGLVGDPVKRNKMDAGTLNKAQARADEQAKESWKVVKGELQFQGHGDNLATVKKYGDFEMLADWKIIDDKKGEGDAGIYLRGTPQVQIWDIARTKAGAEVGSGGLYNNQINESRPLKVADNKLDEWNTFRILMKGDRVSVWLNGELVTDNVILENYWDRNLPIFPEEQIELQAHGSPVAYRDIYIREIPRARPFELSAEEKKDGFEILFDGTNMHSWTGNTTDYIIEDGNIVIRPESGRGSGGNLYTKGEYDDFVFRFEFRLTPGANNGIGIRTPLEGDAAYVGMEIQILDNDADVYKNLMPYQYHGSVYGVIPAKRGYLKPVGEWNREEIYVKGNKIKVTLNDTVIVEGDISEASKNGTLDGKDHPGLKRKSGHIGFLGHGSEVYFRNIRVKKIGFIPMPLN